jgi:MoxR-like ATPase
MQEALDSLCRGQNVFLWGAPGMGKTKFAEALMHELYMSQVSAYS